MEEQQIIDSWQERVRAYQRLTERWPIFGRLAGLELVHTQTDTARLPLSFFLDFASMSSDFPAGLSPSRRAVVISDRPGRGEHSNDSLCPAKTGRGPMIRRASERVCKHPPCLN